jgi:4-hydroxy-3-polyprenylbenzoate decarboxylase
MAQDGILVIEGPQYTEEKTGALHVRELISSLESQKLEGIGWVVIADDPIFTCRSLNNFLWVTFTRSNPSHDVHGVFEFFDHKHWGCEGPLIIDARKKPHHAPELVVDRATTEMVDRLFASGGPLAHLE